MNLSNLTILPKDPILSLGDEYKKDTRKYKIDLTVWVFFDDEAQPYVMPLIQTLTKEYSSSNNNYRAIEGNKQFLESLWNFYFDKTLPDTVASIQTVWWAWALSAYFWLEKENSSDAKVILWNPTRWYYHTISEERKVPIIKVTHVKNNDTDIAGYKEVIENAESWTFLCVQWGHTHNPTGYNFDWKRFIDEIIPLLNAKNMDLLFDVAYLWLWTDIEIEKQELQEIRNKTNNIALATTTSKRATTYNERVWALYIKCKNTEEEKIIKSHMEKKIRWWYTAAPYAFSHIVTAAMEKHKNELINTITETKDSILKRRNMFIEFLGPNFSYLKNTEWIFIQLPLSAKQVEELKEKYAIYVLWNWRINVTGITQNTAKYAADSILSVISK